MQQYERYAIYYAPRDGDFARAMAGWLGWDPRAGQAAPPPPDLPHLPALLADLTRTPRRYGFHGTLKAPFRLAPGLTRADIEAAITHLAARCAPPVLPGLALRCIDGFLALCPEGDDTTLNDLAAEVVTRLDPLRAPLTDREIARRHPETLSPRQRDLLATWGYPHVMEDFRFHLTLTDRLSPEMAAGVAAALGPWLAPLLPRPFVIEDLCLFAEDGAQRFHLLSRHALTG
ncbi:MAG: DUF1045 domain-containing protein [Paracoccaceae bacterium]